MAPDAELAGCLGRKPRDEGRSQVVPVLPVYYAATHATWTLVGRQSPPIASLHGRVRSSVTGACRLDRASRSDRARSACAHRAIGCPWLRARVLRAWCVCALHAPKHQSDAPLIAQEGADVCQPAPSQSAGRSEPRRHVSLSTPRLSVGWWRQGSLAREARSLGRLGLGLGLGLGLLGLGFGLGIASNR